MTNEYSPIRYRNPIQVLTIHRAAKAAARKAVPPTAAGLAKKPSKPSKVSIMVPFAMVSVKTVHSLKGSRQTQRDGSRR